MGTISANGDSQIGELIARAMERVGKEGVITVAEGKTLENELEVVEGMKFDRGYISPYFQTNPKTQKCEMENALVLLYEKKISGLNTILPILEQVRRHQAKAAHTERRAAHHRFLSLSLSLSHPPPRCAPCGGLPPSVALCVGRCSWREAEDFRWKADAPSPCASLTTLHAATPTQVLKVQRPLLIVAEDVESEALATLIMNKLRAGVKVCAVKAPGFGDNRKANLQDIAVLTGGTVISEDLGYKLEECDLSMLGSAKKLTVSKDDTIILDGGGEKAAIEERCDSIRDAMESSNSDYDREKLQERLAKLSGGVAVIKIGGASEVEVNEKKDRVTDALNATRAAVDEGIVAGVCPSCRTTRSALSTLPGSPVRLQNAATRRWTCGAGGSLIPVWVLLRRRYRAAIRVQGVRQGGDG